VSAETDCRSLTVLRLGCSAVLTLAVLLLPTDVLGQVHTVDWLRPRSEESTRWTETKACKVHDLHETEVSKLHDLRVDLSADCSHHDHRPKSTIVAALMQDDDLSRS